MTKLAEHVRTAQWHRLITIVEATQPDYRKEKLLDLYYALEENIRESPASSKVHFHNAFPGGYLDHVLRVYDCVRAMYEMYRLGGGRTIVSANTLAFCALNHDLGKIGDLNEPWYIPETNDYFIKQGSVYKKNPKLGGITPNDQTLYKLQQFGVMLEKEELIAIKLTDGMYADGNEVYLKTNKPDPFDNCLPYVMHWGDHMATIIEKSTRDKTTK